MRFLTALLATLGVAAVAPAVALADAFVPQGLLQGAAAEPQTVAHVIAVGDRGVSTGELKNDVITLPNGRQLGTIRREFKVVNAVALDILGADLQGLARRPGVASITPDGHVEETSADYWPQTVGLPEAWAGVTPSADAPAIAVVDSGVADRPDDFQDRVTDRVNLSSFRTSDSGSDDYGHGTLVAGIAAGGSVAYPGAAPSVPIVSLRVISPGGLSIVSDLLAAADWIYENRVAKGIGVVNFSVRSTFPNYAQKDPLNLAVERLWLTGTVVVASAGNDGPGRMLYAPASSPFVITVGAVDTNGTVGASDDFNAPWSSYGHTGEGFAKPELAAPGRYLVGPVPPLSTLAGLFSERLVAPGYMWMSGTSFAAPVVSGAAAAILARHPDWSPDQVKGALMLTARPLASAEPMSAGVGEIDAAAAAALTAAPSPHENLDDFVRADATTGVPYLDSEAWSDAVSADAAWTSAAWTSAAWTSAAWTSAAWTSAAWTSAAWTSAAWTSAAWTSAAWTSAAWTSAAWTSSSEGS
jgi:serine protease AprX